jgi:antitoxin (DNA-binding transcriptional repressor) of toxin-antitoxin stability system
VVVVAAVASGERALVPNKDDGVARLAPAQSHGWQIYADFLWRAGHTRIAVAAESSAYWIAGVRILRDVLRVTRRHRHRTRHGAHAATAVCDQLFDTRATALLLLAGYPEPAVSIVKSLRGDPHLAEVMIGAPAGQPESATVTA